MVLKFVKKHKRALGAFGLFITSFFSYVGKYGFQIGGFLDLIVNASTLLQPVIVSWLRLIIYLLLIGLTVLVIFRLYRNKSKLPLYEKLKPLKNEGIVLCILTSLYLVSFIPSLVNGNTDKSNLAETTEAIEENENTIKIIVSEFEGLDSKGFGVAGKIKDKIKDSLTTYDNEIEVKRIDEKIDSVAKARKIGKEYGATLVIWGKFYVTKTNVEVYTNYSITSPTINSYLNISETDFPKSVQSVNNHRGLFDNFTIQTDLANEMSYLAFLVLGNIRMYNHDPEKAVEAFTKSLGQSKNSDGFHAYLYRGICHLNLGNLNKGTEDLQTAIRINPNNEYAHMWITHAYDRSQNTELVEYHYKRALAISPKNPAILACRCDYYQNAGDFNKAEIDCENAVSQGKNADAYLARGVLKDRKLKNLLNHPTEAFPEADLVNLSEEAIADISKAAEIEELPQTDTYASRAIAYTTKYRVTHDNELLSKAVKDAEKARELSPKYFQPYLILSDISLLVGDKDKWQRNFQKALEFAPKGIKFRLYMQRASNYVDDLNYSSALNDYSKAQELFPNATYVSYKIGQTRYLKTLSGNRDEKHFLEALDLFNLVLKQQKDYAPALRMKGQTLYFLGNTKAAIRYCKESLRQSIKKKSEVNKKAAEECLSCIATRCL